MREMHQQMLENQISNSQASIANNASSQLGDTSNETPQKIMKENPIDKAAIEILEKTIKNIYRRGSVT